MTKSDFVKLRLDRPGGLDRPASAGGSTIRGEGLGDGFALKYFRKGFDGEILRSFFTPHFF